MFKALTDSIENALDVVDGVLTGEGVTMRQIARLLSDGMTVAAAAASLGVAVEIVQAVADSD